MLVQHFLENSAERVPDKVALIYDDQRLTYREINSLANQLAASLIDRGVKRQDRVVIFLDNSIESVISLFGILKIGAIFIILNPTMKSKKLNYILNDSGACALITQTNRAGIVKKAINKAPTLKHIFWVGKHNQLSETPSFTISSHEWGEIISTPYSSIL